MHIIKEVFRSYIIRSYRCTTLHLWKLFMGYTTLMETICILYYTYGNFILHLWKLIYNKKVLHYTYGNKRVLFHKDI